MNDQDIIRKAVKLAPDDAWRLVEDDVLHLATAQWFLRLQLPQWALDALAAQLVRQVDALPDVYFYTGESEGTFYAEFAIEGEDPKWKFLRAGHLVKGPDRTMNTLRVVVESGVLDKLREVGDE